MAAGYAFPKQLGQGAPGTTDTTIATISANSRGAVGITITVSNKNAAAQTYRLYITPSGGTKRYIAYSEPIAIGGSRVHAIPGLAPSDVIGAYGSSTDVEFTVEGLEIS